MGKKEKERGERSGKHLKKIVSHDRSGTVELRGRSAVGPNYLGTESFPDIGGYFLLTSSTRRYVYRSSTVVRYVLECRVVNPANIAGKPTMYEQMAATEKKETSAYRTPVRREVRAVTFIRKKNVTE